MKSSPLTPKGGINTINMLILLISLLVSCDNQQVELMQLPAQKIAKKEQVISKFYTLENGRMALFFTDTIKKNFNSENLLLSEENILFYDYNGNNNEENVLKNSLKTIYITKKNDTNIQKSYLYYYLKNKMEIRQKINGKEEICIEIVEDTKQNVVQQTFFDENNPVEITSENLFIYKEKNSNLLQEKKQLLYEKNEIKVRISTFFEYNADGNIIKKIKFNAKNNKNMNQKRFVYGELDTLRTQQKQYIYNDKKQVYKIKTSKIMPLNANINDFILSENIFEYDTQGRCTQVRTYMPTKVSAQTPIQASADTITRSIVRYEYKEKGI